MMMKMMYGMVLNITPPDENETYYIAIGEEKGFKTLLWNTYIEPRTNEEQEMLDMLKPRDKVFIIITHVFKGKYVGNICIDKIVKFNYKQCDQCLLPLSNPHCMGEHNILPGNLHG